MNELYKRALEKRNSYRRGVPPNGMDAALFYRLRRAGYASGEGIDINLIRSEIENGALWRRHGIGERTVEAVCDWLEGHSDT